MGNSASECFHTTTIGKAIYEGFQHGLQDLSTNQDAFRTADLRGFLAGGCSGLEKRGILPEFKIDGVDRRDLQDPRGPFKMLKGILENDPKAIAEAAGRLPDGDYNVAEMIRVAEKLGLLHLHSRQEQELLDDLQSIRKNGDHFEIRLKRPLTERVGRRNIVVESDVQFDLSHGDPPGIKNIKGVHTAGGCFGVGNAEIQAIYIQKNDNGSYDYKVHHGGVLFGIGSGDVTIHNDGTSARKAPPPGHHHLITAELTNAESNETSKSTDELILFPALRLI